MTIAAEGNFLRRLLQRGLPLEKAPRGQRQTTVAKWHRSRRKPSPSFREIKIGQQLNNCDINHDDTLERGGRVGGRNYLLKSNLSILSLFVLVLIVLEEIVSLGVHGALIINVLNTAHNPTGTQHSTARFRRAAHPVPEVNATTTGAGRLSSAAKSAKLIQSATGVDALSYLERYGYMNKSSSPNANLISEDSFENAVMSFQRFAGIPETGTVDSMTVKYMQMPRCGNKDQSGKGENGRRRKRYALQGSKWRRQELTYRISQYPTRFAGRQKSEVDGQIEKAFKIWSQVAPIDFVVKKEGRVHIDIRFASGEHGDGDPFDGPGNTLAHAYFPQYGGDAHFDDQEFWTVDSYAGTNIFQVAAHELGHSLGLGHSSVREALMAPFYQKYKPNFKLHADDVLAIQALYGERDDSTAGSSTTNKPPTTSSTSTTTISSRDSPPDSDDNDDDDGGIFGFGGGGGSSKPVDLCQDSKIDAVTRTQDGNTYVFRNQHYWQIKNEGLANGGQAAKISRDWDGLPGNLDAALTWSDGKTFFFKGDKYWRFFNKRREPGYPKLISAGFAGIPNNVDGSFVWSGNGKTYFFKKDKYWRFDSKQEPPVSSQYPKSIKNWSGLPTSGIDDAFKWDNGMTYFFKDDLYYRFDDREFEVDTSARPTFPRSTAEWWFGCTNGNLPLLASKAANSKPSASDSDELSKSMLLFHRMPNLLYSNQADSSQDLTAAAATSADSQLNVADKPKPAGNSLSRSILNSLSGLFGSSGSDEDKQSSSSATSANQQNDDWSFHRGMAEEVRRTLGSALNSAFNRPQATIVNNNINKAKRATESAAPDNSRWLFPLSTSLSSSSHFGHPPSREKSLSELRMEPSGAGEAK